MLITSNYPFVNNNVIINMFAFDYELNLNNSSVMIDIMKKFPA